ncbi:heavy-metal-associated domain-containing protein [Paenibacillus chartarius]|uniref:Heavy-metal-associated domain-containing protein n=1 Tax=Paenibacillus chartarius TaxID=747481 RepID=A0ABV6DR41_9BACL
MSQATFKVAGMTGEHCADSVEGALQQIGAKGHVDLTGAMVTVQYDDSRVSMNDIKGAIEGVGFKIV